MGTSYTPAGINNSLEFDNTLEHSFMMGPISVQEMSNAAGAVADELALLKNHEWESDNENNDSVVTQSDHFTNDAMPEQSTAARNLGIESSSNIDCDFDFNNPIQPVAICSNEFSTSSQEAQFSERLIKLAISMKRSETSRAQILKARLLEQIYGCNQPLLIPQQFSNSVETSSISLQIPLNAPMINDASINTAGFYETNPSMSRSNEYSDQPIGYHLPGQYTR